MKVCKTKLNRFMPLRSLLILLAVVLLSGCVRSETGITFNSPNSGEIVQHIRLEEKLTRFGESAAQDWLDRLEQQAKRLGGKVQHPFADERVITIPFNNAADLQDKFNALLSPPESDDQLPDLTSNLQLHANNFLLVQRNRLQYDLDLRSLAVRSGEGQVLISPGALVTFHFRLKTPWGARVSKSSRSANEEAKELVWTLQPGELNHLEAVFWMPIPLGIGALVILVLVVAGSYLKGLLSAGTIDSPLAEAIHSRNV